ncbi:MAG: pyridoxal phosphate-dependent aminotransferase [Trueperaceae bacterium]|nr:pyridoxal phosphate-dependent aminotransferase [Trueperaceae bacterium]
MRFSPLVERIAGEAADAWKLHSRASRAAKHDPEVILLSVGDPDLDTPKPIVDRLIESVLAGRTHYSSGLGEPDLREAVAKHYNRKGFSQVSARNVVIVPGTQNGLFAAAMCLLAQGDEIIIPEPMYVTYPGFVGATGASVVSVSLKGEDGFALHPDDIARAITPKTRAILLNSPNNPTGAVIPRETLEAVAELCQQHDLWLLSDEVYLDLYYSHQPTSALALDTMYERTVVVSSLSKSHAMTGWRLGWIIAPEALVGHLSNLLSSMMYGASMFIQDAAVAAFEVPELVETMREIYRSRREVMLERCKSMPGLTCLEPEGGMFVMLDVRKTGISATTFAERFFDTQKVSLLPADAFGPSAKGFLRLSLCVNEAKLHDVCDRLERFLESLD